MSTPPIYAATEGEVYVSLAGSTQAFPATIDYKRWNGFVAPRFRRAVAEAVVVWLNTNHNHEPGRWTNTATFNDDALTILDTEENRPELIEPDSNGRYGIGAGGWCWELSTPPTDEHADAALLTDSARLAAEDGEILVTINIDGTDPVFPALATEGHRWGRAGSLRFRRTVAEVVVAWINDTARKYPGVSESAHWDGDTLVLLDQQAINEDGYLPDRISAEDGRYSISSTFEWERAD